MKSCPQCQYPLEADARICLKCGCDLESPDATPPPVVQSECVRAELAEDLKGLADLSRQDLIGDAVPRQTSTLPPRPSTLHPRSSTPSTPAPRPSSQCDDLDIKYNTARIFVEGMILPFDFKITPRTEGISDISIEIRCSDYARVTDQPPEEPTRDFTMPVHLAFRAPRGFPGGLVPFEIYVGYKKSGKQAWFVARQVHTVHAAGENAGRAIENVRIEIQNKIDQGNASDINLNQDFSEYMAQLKSSHLDQSVEQLARFDLPEVWTTLAMHRCRKQSFAERMFAPSRQSTPPAEACQTRITLQNKETRWHLLSETAYQLGRSRTESDVVTRFAGDLFQHSAAISRVHFRIERTGNTWRVFDGGYDTSRRTVRRSGLGSFLDGRELDTDEGVDLVPGSTHELTLGRPGSGKGPTFKWDLEVLSWDDIREDERRLLDEDGRLAQTPPALILRSPFIEHDVFALLWHILPVRRLDARLHSLCFVRRTEAFQVCGPQTDCTWLTPGREVRLLNHSFCVSDFEQRIPRGSG